METAATAPRAEPARPVEISVGWTERLMQSKSGEDEQGCPLANVYKCPQVKAFLTRRVDRIRLPYGRRVVSLQRGSPFSPDQSTVKLG